jgi:hypothetical protein
MQINESKRQSRDYNGNRNFYTYNGGYNRSHYSKESSIYEDAKYKSRASVGAKVAPKNNNLIHILTTHYEGMCNYLIFSKECTPGIHKNETDYLGISCLSDYLNQFERVSAFGLDTNYLLESNTIVNLDELCNVNYTPTLSSMELYITEAEACKKVLEELMILRNDCEDKFVVQNRKTNNFVYHCKENISISHIDGKIKIEYYENKPPHSRYILTEQFKTIMTSLKTLPNIILESIDKASWFCILWTPIKSNKQQFLNTSFLVYYQFDLTSNSQYYVDTFSSFVEIPIVGILPTKFEDNTWLTKISKGINL